MRYVLLLFHLEEEKNWGKKKLKFSQDYTASGKAKIPNMGLVWHGPPACNMSWGGCEGFCKRDDIRGRSSKLTLVVEKVKRAFGKPMRTLDSSLGMAEAHLFSVLWNINCVAHAICTTIYFSILLTKGIFLFLLVFFFVWCFIIINVPGYFRFVSRYTFVEVSCGCN